MHRITFVTLIGLVAACTEQPSGASGGNLPENIRALAAPDQNLATARLREEDGCYWYTHVGPVETTEVPLRSVEGRPICARAPEAPAATG